MPSSGWKLVETAVETAGRGFASATAFATSARLPELVPEEVPVALAAAFKTFWMRLIGNLAALAALAADCWISAVTALCKVFATALQTANTISILWVYKKNQWTSMNSLQNESYLFTLTYLECLCRMPSNCFESNFSVLSRIWMTSSSSESSSCERFWIKLQTQVTRSQGQPFVSSSHWKISMKGMQMHFICRCPQANVCQSDVPNGFSPLFVDNFEDLRSFARLLRINPILPILNTPHMGPQNEYT